MVLMFFVLIIYSCKAFQSFTTRRQKERFLMFNLPRFFASFLECPLVLPRLLCTWQWLLGIDPVLASDDLVDLDHVTSQMSVVQRW